MEEKVKKLNDELEGSEVTELDDADLDDVAGGLPNNNCGNTQCCGAEH